MGWKLAAVIAGAPERLLDTYEEERRPIAADVLGLSTRLLQALKERGEIRRGREGQQLDLGYAGSSLALATPERDTKLLVAGDRAPDAPLRGRGGQAIRAFHLYHGGHWTLLGFDTPAAASPAPRHNLHIHRIGEHGDVLDAHGSFRAAYGVAGGDWVLVRPDGYVGAIVSAHDVDSLRAYLQEWIRDPRGYAPTTAATFHSAGHVIGESKPPQLCQDHRGQGWRT